MKTNFPTLPPEYAAHLRAAQRGETIQFRRIGAADWYTFSSARSAAAILKQGPVEGWEHRAKPLPTREDLKLEAIAEANAHLSNVGLPTYSEVVDLLHRYTVVYGVEHHQPGTLPHEAHAALVKVGKEAA